MMAELAPLNGVSSATPRGKFGTGAVLAYYYTFKFLYSWNCKGPRKCNGINLTYGLSELVLRNKN